MKKRKFPKKAVINAIIMLFLSAIVSVALTYYFNSKINEITLTFEEAIAVRDSELSKYRSAVKKSFIFVRDVEAGETISNADVQLVEIPGFYLPNDVLTDPNDVIGKITKINVSKNTPITGDMIYEKGAVDPSDRRIEIDYVSLPIMLKEHDLVDIVITFPTGEVYRVVSKKSIDHMDLASQHLFITANAEERYLLTSALRDAYVYNAELSAIRYVDPELQNKPLEDYHPNESVLSLITTSPYVKNKDRYASSVSLRRALEQRLEDLPDDQKIRLGADLPSGSAVDKKRKTIGATIVIPAESDTKGNGEEETSSPPETVDNFSPEDTETNYIDSDVYVPEDESYVDDEGIGAE